MDLIIMNNVCFIFQSNLHDRFFKCTDVRQCDDVAGAQKEGAAGFFKGMGKGLVGAVARPTGGIIDMASSTFQGIKRCGYFCVFVNLH